MLTVMITLSDHFSLLVLNLSGLWTTSVKPPTPSIWNMTCIIKHLNISVGIYVPFNVRMSITVSAIAFTTYTTTTFSLSFWFSLCDVKGKR